MFIQLSIWKYHPFFPSPWIWMYVSDQYCYFYVRQPTTGCRLALHGFLATVWSFDYPYISHQRYGVSFHRLLECLPKTLPLLTTKRSHKLCITTRLMGGFPAQTASKAESVSISWRRHIKIMKVAVYKRRIYKSNVWGLIKTKVPTKIKVNPTGHKKFKFDPVSNDWHDT